MGTVDDSKSYTIQALADTLGYKQARSVERLLREICCPVFSIGKRKMVSGRQFREALEKASKCSNTYRLGS